MGGAAVGTIWRRCRLRSSTLLSSRKESVLYQDMHKAYLTIVAGPTHDLQDMYYILTSPRGECERRL